MPTEVSGPHVAVAAIFEKVLHEKDGVLSLIRMVDRFTVAISADVPDPLPPIVFQGLLFVGLKSDQVNGSFMIKTTLSRPNGQEEQISIAQTLFEGDDRGVNLAVNLQLQIEEQGLHWINVYFGEERLTRVPMRVIVQRTAI